MTNRRNPSSCFPLLQNRAPMQHLTAVIVNLGTPHSEQTHGEIQRENTIPGRSRFQGYHLSAGKRTLPSSAGRHKPRTQHRGAASVGGRSWQGSHWAVTSWKEWKVRSTGGSALPGPARVMCTVKWGTERIHPESNPTAWTRAPLKGNTSPASVLHLICSTSTAMSPPKPSHLEQTMQCFPSNRWLKTFPFSSSGKTQNKNAQVKPCTT